MTKTNLQNKSPSLFLPPPPSSPSKGQWVYGSRVPAGSHPQRSIRTGAPRFQIRNILIYTRRLVQFPFMWHVYCRLQSRYCAKSHAKWIDPMLTKLIGLQRVKMLKSLWHRDLRPWTRTEFLRGPNARAHYVISGGLPFPELRRCTVFWNIVIFIQLLFTVFLWGELSTQMKLYIYINL